MMNRILALILSLILLTLCGCTQHPGIDGSTPANSSSSLTDPPTDPPTNPTTTSPTTEATVPTTVPVDENIEFFTDLLTPYHDGLETEFPYGWNHYNMAMCCVFSCPEELPLALFFYNGLTNYQVTEEERNFVDDYLESMGLLPLEANRLVPEEMNEVLQAYFDISLDDIKENHLLYWDKTGYYYTACSDMLMCEGFVINAVEELDNGIFKICYTTRYEGDFVITLQSRESEGGEGFRILSNLPA